MLSKGYAVLYGKLVGIVVNSNAGELTLRCSNGKKEYRVKEDNVTVIMDPKSIASVFESKVKNV